jgi:RHS repeat-associated protein
MTYTVVPATPPANNPGHVADILITTSDTHSDPQYQAGDLIPIEATTYYSNPGRNMGQSCDCAGDPINLDSGNEYRDEQDISLGDLSLHRYYNSHPAVSAAHFGAQWRDNFDSSLEFLYDPTYINGGGPAVTVIAHRPDGQQVQFSSGGTGWVGPSDVGDTLTQQRDSSGNIIGWLYLEASTRNVEIYDLSGNLLAITTPNGQTTTLTYSTSSTPVSVAPVAGLLIAVTDAKGRSLQFTYNAQSQVSTVAEPDGSVLQYSYDANGNLAKVIYPDQSSREFVYNESNLMGGLNMPNVLTGDIDETGARYTSIGYTGFNLSNVPLAVMSMVGTGIDKTATSYSYNSTSTGVTYATGVTTSLTLSVGSVTGKIHTTGLSKACGPQCGQPNKAATFDGNGYPASTTDWNGNVTATTYSSTGLLTQRIDAQGQSAQRTTNFTWNTTLRVPLTRTVQDKKGTTVAFTSWTYNSTGETTARCEADPSVSGATSYSCGSSAHAPSGVRQWTYTYCNTVDSTQCPLAGLLLAVDGPRTDATDVTRYSYYLTTDESGCGTPAGACHRAGDLYQVTNALGQTSTYVTYDKNGHVVRQSDANGVITDLTYHPRGWLLTRTVRVNADGTSSINDAVTTISYKPYGAVASIIDPDGIKVSYTYDATHRLTDITDAMNNRIHYILDAAGNKTSEQTYDSGNALRRSLSHTYDSLGQLTKITDGLSNVVFNAGYSDSYDANGNLTHSADALGVQRKHAYDGLNRLIQTLDNYNGTDTATQNTQSTFVYDANDRLQSVGDPDGLSTAYTFDGLGNTISVQSPDTGTTSYVYDAAGNVTQHTDAKAIVSTSTYDVLNRVISIRYSSDTTLAVTYAYDEPNSTTGCVSSYPLGRLTRIVETNVTTVYCYDLHGNVIQKRQTQGTITDTSTYSYTMADRLSGTVTASGTSIQYSRDGNGRISSITVLPPGTTGAGANVVTAITYLPFGPIASYTLGNGQVVNRSYDANYQLTDLVSPAFNWHVARDPMGNVVALGNAAGASPATETYTYDPLYRLTGLKNASGNVEEAYTYSHAGDRLSKTSSGIDTGTYTYKKGTHHLSSIGNAARAYDADGNTTSSVEGGTTFGYGYNGRNRMTLVQRGGNTVGTYTYNALGQRTAKVATFPTSINQRFVYDEESHLLGEYGSSARDYIWLNNLPVAIIDTNGTASTTNYVTADGLNTPRAIANANGNTVWQLAYQDNPFGEQQPTSSAGFTYNLRFPGQYYDAETGLGYNVNRDYDAAEGRYIQSDPLGLRGGPSTYSYVASNPLASTDPLGLWCAQNNGFLTCVYPNGGPAFTIPAQPGFPALLGPGDGNLGGDDLYHDYDVTRSIGCADPNDVTQGLIDNPTPPAGNPQPATPGGTPNNAAVPGVAPVNPVTSYLTSDLNTGAAIVVNVTGPHSVFGPGYVARTVTDGIAHTYGEGEAWSQSDMGMDGPNPFMDLGNWAVDEAVWGEQMDQIIAKAKKKCGCKP